MTYDCISSVERVRRRISERGIRSCPTSTVRSVPCRPAVTRGNAPECSARLWIPSGRSRCPCASLARDTQTDTWPRILYTGTHLTQYTCNYGQTMIEYIKQN